MTRPDVTPGSPALPASTDPPAAVSHRRDRLRSWARRRRSTHLALQGVVLVLGLGLTALGLAMLVLPGPGWAAIILGLVVLASEFAWAERALHPVRTRARQGFDAVRRTRYGRLVLVSGVALGAVAAAAGAAAFASRL